MKVKGAAFERRVVAFLRQVGIPADRSYGAGRKDDRGDIDGLPRWVIECKAHKALDLAAWMDEAQREQACAGTDYAAVIAKRRNRPAESAYVILDLATFCRLITEMEGQR